MLFTFTQKFNLILKKKNVKKLIFNYKHFSVGRNIKGKIVVRHRGRLLKQSYRLIDFL